MLAVRLRVVLVLLGLAFVTAAPRPARAQQAAELKAIEGDAVRAFEDGNYKLALEKIEEGLAKAPKDLKLLDLRGKVLMETRDFEGALAAYEAYLAAGPRGAPKRAAEKITRNLQVIRTTFIEVNVGEGSANVYLDNRSAGVFCAAAPSCKKGVLPGDYKVMVEREGYEPGSQNVTVEVNQTAQVKLALVPKAAELSIDSVPPGAQVSVDGTAAGTTPVKLPVPAGAHKIEATRPGFAPETIEVTTKPATPETATLTLHEQVKVTVSAGAKLFLDGKPVELVNGMLTLPPGNADHTLTAKQPGREDASVAIPSAHTTPLELTLTPGATRAARLTLRGVPDGAKVRVDGKLVAMAPLRAPIEVSPGKHELRVDAKGGPSYRYPGTFDRDATLDVTVTPPRAPSRTGSRIFFGLAVGGALAAVTYGVIAYEHQQDYDARAQMPYVPADDAELARLKRDGQDALLFSGIASGAGALCLGAALVLHFTQEEEPGRIEVQVAPTSVGVRGRF
jgi:PEGA domain